jgi:hypothetical protein
MVPAASAGIILKAEYSILVNRITNKTAETTLFILPSPRTKYAINVVSRCISNLPNQPIEESSIHNKDNNACLSSAKKVGYRNQWNPD